MTSREKVLSVYPDAFEAISGRIWRDNCGGQAPILLGLDWDDAASKLPSAPSPEGHEVYDESGFAVAAMLPRAPEAGETASEPCDICHQPLVFPADDDPQYAGDTAVTSMCRHTIRFRAVPEPVPTEVCRNCGKTRDQHVYGISGIPGCHNNSASTVFESAAPIAPAAEEPAASPVAGVSAAISGSVAGWTLYRAVRDFLDSARSGTPFGLEVMDAAVSEWEAENPPSAQPSAEGDGWIAVTERLPEEGEPVLVSSQYWSANAFVARLHHGEWEGERILSRPDSVTHWRLLPAPPSGQGEKK